MSKSLGPINYFGGKGRLASWILSLMPQHRLYVEVFGGGASLLFAKGPSRVEVYNDIDTGLVGFFRVLRDPEQFPELVRRLDLIPYSRTEYNAFRRNWFESEDPIERAVRWFAVARMSFSGHWGHSWGFDHREGRSVQNWLRAIEALPAFHDRLRRVYIDQDDWRDIVDRYDGPDVLLYCDPPYVWESRKSGSYLNEMTDTEHAELVTRLLTVQGMVMLSGYPSSVYAPLEQSGWHRVTRQFKLQAGNNRNRACQYRTEALWLNPACLAAQRQLTLWDGGEMNADNAPASSPDDSRERERLGACESHGRDL